MGICSCTTNKSRSDSQTDIATPQMEQDTIYLNSVKGHKEENFIVGNFTGLGMDTIFIADTPLRELSNAERKRLGFGLGNGTESYPIRYAVSNNSDIPPVEVYSPSGLVLEGDVDGDGKDEWGYLYEWMTSQWRQYRIYNYDSKTKTWRHLYYGDLLDTSEFVRSSGVDIVEKGPRPGFIKINYDTGGLKCELKDTIVKPTYTRISKDAW